MNRNRKCEEKERVFPPPRQIRAHLPIKRGDLEIGPIGKRDTADLFRSAVRSHEELMDWMDWSERFLLRDAHRWVRERIRSWRRSTTTHRSILGLVIRRHGQLVGCMDLSVFYSRDAGLAASYWIDSEYAGQGIARQALHMLASFCFSTLHVPRFYVLVDQKNLASQSVVRHVRGERDGVMLGWKKVDQSRKAGGAQDIWKLTRATIQPEERLFDPLPDTLWRFPPSVDLKRDRTGIPGTIRLYSHVDSSICVHYFETNDDEDLCFPLTRRDDRSQYINQNKTIDPRRAQSIRRWIARNRRIIRDYGTNGDLWTVEERDAILAKIQPLPDAVTPTSP